MFGVTLLALLFAVCLTMAGCGGSDTSSAESSEAASSAASQISSVEETSSQAESSEVSSEKSDPGSTASVVTVDDKGVEQSSGKSGTTSGSGSGDVDLTGVDPDKPMVALTFDDGPGSGTEQILSVLQQYNAKATFFELGECVNNYPELTKKVKEAGMQVGSHSYDHPDLATLSNEAVAEQFSKTESALQNAAGITPTICRVPYGSVSESLQSITPYPIILWDIDTLDWSSRDADTICSLVKSSTVTDGDILLFHDIYTSTADAIETLVPYLQDQGFQLVTIDQMFAAKGTKLVNGTIYYNA